MALSCGPAFSGLGVADALSPLGLPKLWVRSVPKWVPSAVDIWAGWLLWLPAVCCQWSDLNSAECTVYLVWLALGAFWGRFE